MTVHARTTSRSTMSYTFAHTTRHVRQVSNLLFERAHTAASTSIQSPRTKPADWLQAVERVMDFARTSHMPQQLHPIPTLHNLASRDTALQRASHSTPPLHLPDRLSDPVYLQALNLPRRRRWSSSCCHYACTFSACSLMTLPYLHATQTGVSTWIPARPQVLAVQECACSVRAQKN